MEIQTNLVWLNKHNGADKIEAEYMQKCLDEFEGTLYGVVMGSAYGGALEYMGKLWKGRGEVYGFDTFEDKHPEKLAVSTGDREARCMDHWYKSDIYGTDGLAYDYQRGVLDSAGLDNVHLIKGLVSEESCKDLPHINYAFLDMDILVSMHTGYKAVRDLLVPGGYLLLHDVTIKGNLPLLYDWYHQEIRDKYEVVYESPNTHLAVLKNNEKA